MFRMRSCNMRSCSLPAYVNICMQDVVVAKSECAQQREVTKELKKLQEALDEQLRKANKASDKLADSTKTSVKFSQHKKVLPITCICARTTC